MTSTTDPTVLHPTSTDTDDDDDDDDVSSALLSSQLPAATTPPLVQPTVPAPASVTPPAGTSDSEDPSLTPVPTTTSGTSPYRTGQASVSNAMGLSSATELADRLPSGSATALNPEGSMNESNGDGEGLGMGASAGIGIGVALIVCLAAFGMWFFLRRRIPHRSEDRSTSSHNSDEEHAEKPSKANVYACCEGGLVEVSGDEKPRRWGELESPIFIAEAGDGQIFRAELPNSAVPAAPAVRFGDERLFVDLPIEEVDEPGDAEGATDKKNERLFSDPPLDEGSGALETDKSSTLAEKKELLQ